MIQRILTIGIQRKGEKRLQKEKKKDTEKRGKINIDICVNKNKAENEMGDDIDRDVRKIIHTEKETDRAR